MKVFKKWSISFITSMKIKNKILMLSVIILLVPCVLFAFISTDYYQTHKIENEKQIIKNEVDEAYTQLSNTIEICTMTMQTMMLNGKIEKFIDKLIVEETLSVHELIDFNNTEIRAIERLVNTNPYIHSVRFYINAPILELAPAIYRMNRFVGGEPIQNTDVSAWYFNNTDSISPIEKVSPYPEALATLVAPYSDMNGNVIGAIEIATPMKILFPSMYETTEEKIMYFVDKEKVAHQVISEESKQWEVHSNEITKHFIEDSGIQVIDLQGESVIVGYKAVKVIEGYIVIAQSLKSVEEQVKSIRLLVGVVVVLLVTIISVLINISTKLVFRNFYRVLEGIQEIQRGNLDISLEDYGKGEIGELGSNVQKLAKDMKNLMAEKVSREILVKDAQIKALQNQINAHFIYNVLESIKMMAEIEGMFDISDAITHLGKLLRYSMRWHSSKVRVEEELAYIKNYMALLNLRYDYEVKLEIVMPEDILKQHIPKMCIQPIVENAMKHGIEDVAEDTTIYIKGKQVEDGFEIEVTDFGVGMNREQLEQIKNHSSNGIGLKNVEERIQMCFGKAYGLGVVSKEGYFTKVIIKIPYK